jgi:hypothetical protein
MGWWNDSDWYPEEDIYENGKESIKYVQQVCGHVWKPTVLIISKVYDCKLCGVKKEDYEKWVRGLDK